LALDISSSAIFSSFLQFDLAEFEVTVIAKSIYKLIKVEKQALKEFV